MSDPITRLNTALEGRYRIERELGEGGMATVYLAHDVRHERHVALKLLKPELAAVVGAERFLAEIKTTANLQHPHILPLFDSGETDGFLFYVMPFVEGESLRERLDRERQLPVDEAVRIATNVAEALDYAHSHGVIHRDIKPENILLQVGKPVVSDFGIALAVGAAGGGRLTETGLSLGTPHYMSPEQATGELNVGATSDIYALACVLYEMLVAEPPYTGGTPQAILGKIVTGDADSVTKHRGSVPANVDAAVRKALEKVPADRFRAAQDFATALADPAFRHGDRIAAALPSRAGPWKAASVALAAALVLGVGWPVLRPQPTPAVSRYSIALPVAQAFTEAARGAGLAVSPDGEWFVYTGLGESGQSQLWLRPRDQLVAAPLPGTDGAGNPSVSPDGSRVAFTTGPGLRQMRLMIAAIGGGPPLVVEDSLVDWGGVSWGYDGYIYYDAGLEGDGIARVREGGGTPEPVTMPRAENGEVWHSQPHALPNGRGVLFSLRRSDGTFDVAVVDLDTGEHEVLVPGGSSAVYSTTGHLLYLSGDGTLLGAPFDQDELALRGDAVAIVNGVRVRGFPRADLALSAAGTLLYRAGAPGGDKLEMLWITRDGMVSEIDPAWPAGEYRNPSLSPDGRQMALTVLQNDESHIWLKQLPEGRFARFTTEGLNTLATWAANGRVLAFLSDRGGDSDLYQQPADGSAPPRLVLDAPAGVRLATYSADGEWVVYSSEWDIYGLRLDSLGAPAGEPVALLASEAVETRPELSPDGRWLAFQSGEPTVYVCPFPACDVTYPVSVAGGVRPFWARDGSELFYVDPVRQVLLSVEVGPGTPSGWSGPRELFSVAEFYGASARPMDVAPEGERFVVMRRGGGAQPAELIVVQNFSQVLGELAPLR